MAHLAAAGRWDAAGANVLGLILCYRLCDGLSNGISWRASVLHGHRLGVTLHVSLSIGMASRTRWLSRKMLSIALVGSLLHSLLLRRMLWLLPVPRGSLPTVWSTLGKVSRSVGVGHRIRSKVVVIERARHGQEISECAEQQTHGQKEEMRVYFIGRAVSVPSTCS